MRQRGRNEEETVNFVPVSICIFVYLLADAENPVFAFSEILLFKFRFCFSLEILEIHFVIFKHLSTG